MSSFKYYIGIDPDVEKSGVALWNSEKKDFEFIASVEFWDLIRFFTMGHYQNFLDVTWNAMDVQVVVEAGWIIEKSNFHNKIKKQSVREKVAKNVGMNHQIGKLIVSYCERNNIDCEIVTPQGHKLPDATFRNITKWKGTTNQDNRDAALLVFKK